MDLNTVKMQNKYQTTNSIGVVGANVSFGQPHSGVCTAADEIRKHGLGLVLKNYFHKINDYGNVTAHSEKTKCFKKNEPDLFNLYNTCVQSLKENNFSLFIGGDHSIGISTVAAVKKVYKEALVLWVDAHADLNTPSESMTNNLHGMPVSFLMGLNKQDYPLHYRWAHESLMPSDLGYIGIRDVDPAEQKIINQLGIPYITTQEIQKMGMLKTLNALLDKLDPDENRPIHISFDVDSLDPAIVSSTGVPVQEGLLLENVLQLFSHVAEKRNVVSMDFVELNPDLSKNKEQLSSEVKVLFGLINELHPLVVSKEAGLQRSH